MPATNGLLIMAGSSPSLSKTSGRIEPVNVPVRTTKTNVMGTTKIAESRVQYPATTP